MSNFSCSLTTHYGELRFSQLTYIEDDYTTNSHSLTYYLWVNVGRMYFLNLGVEGLMGNNKILLLKNLSWRLESSNKAS